MPERPARRGLVLALGDGATWFVERGPAVIGRTPAADLQVRSAVIARRHAQLVQVDGAWAIEDLASSGGISVNGTRTRRAILAVGDELGLGDTGARVVALDHVAAPGEFPLRHVVDVRCRGLPCAGRVELVTAIGDAAAEVALAELLVTHAAGAVTHAPCHTEVELADPVGALHDLWAFTEARQLGAAACRATLQRLVVGADALELLASGGRPAEVAWEHLHAWRVAPLAAVPSLIGLGRARPDDPAGDALWTELLAAAPAEPGAIVWVWHAADAAGQLYRLARGSGEAIVLLASPRYALLFSDPGLALQTDDGRAPQPLLPGAPHRIGPVTVTLLA